MTEATMPESMSLDQLEDAYGFVASQMVLEPGNLALIRNSSFGDVVHIQDLIYHRFVKQQFPDGKIPDSIDENLQQDPQVKTVKSIETFLINNHADLYFSERQKQFPAFLYSKEELRAVQTTVKTGINRTNLTEDQRTRLDNFADKFLGVEIKLR